MEDIWLKLKCLKIIYEHLLLSAADERHDFEHFKKCNANCTITVIQGGSKN